MFNIFFVYLRRVYRIHSSLRTLSYSLRIVQRVKNYFSQVLVEYRKNVLKYVVVGFSYYVLNSEGTRERFNKIYKLLR